MSSIIIILYQLQVGNYCLSSRQEVVNWFDYYLWHSFLYRDMLKKETEKESSLIKKWFDWYRVIKRLLIGYHSYPNNCDVTKENL